MFPLILMAMENNEDRALIEELYLSISSGVLLLREIDPGLKTPAANNLITGSSFGIILGAPVLIFVGLAPRSDMMCWLVVGLVAVYLAALYLLIFKAKGRKKV